MKTIYYPGWGVVWKIYSRENLKKSIWYYTINAIKDVVINIFNLGQYVQVYAEKTEDDEINEKGFE